jgi:hypothetical protein
MELQSDPQHMHMVQSRLHITLTVHWHYKPLLLMKSQLMKHPHLYAYGRDCMNDICTSYLIARVDDLTV